MLAKLAFASLLAFSTSTLAVADAPTKAPQPKPGLSSCSTTGAVTPLFQIERKRDKRTVVAESIGTRLSISSNGAWTYTETKLEAGTVVSTTGGCLAAGDLATLKTSLAKATWKTTRTGPMCEIYAPEFLEYSHLGKLVLTSRRCDGLVLDAATTQALADATSITSKLAPKK